MKNQNADGSRQTANSRHPESKLPPASSFLPPEVERYEFFEEPRYQFELDRRDFFKLAGAGIVVCLFLDDVTAQQPRQGFGQRGPSELSAWLHISETGKVTVYTGKVEIGQNVRTSLSQVVAEELRLPISAVTMVMADTDLVPFDAGTFGSQSTPQMASQLRRAGAAAREMLIDLAAEEAKVDRSTLVLSDGKVTDPASNKSVTFGDLTKGKKLTKTVGANAPVTPAKDWKLAGTSVPKVEGRAIVTGTHKFAPDIQRPGMLFGKVLRAPALNSTLASVDLKDAKAMSGVIVVQDGDFVGVAAPTELQAEQALEAIKAEWKTPPQPSNKELFDYLKKNVGQGGGGGGFGGRGAESRGSIDKGLAAADQKVEATYTIAYIAHAPLEPRSAVAEWQDGKLTVWHGIQTPFRARNDLATAFRLSPEKVRVIAPDTGSGYGGKQSSEAAQEAARLAKAAGKAVKLVWTRAEEFMWAYFRPAGVIDVNAGVTKDGTITAWEFHNYNSGGSGLSPKYDIANVKTVFHQSKSPLRQGSYRALASTANHFARECHIDDLAHAVQMEPLEFRLKNIKDERLRAVLQAAAKQFGWGVKPPADHGVGIAGGFEKNSYVATCAEVVIDKTGGRVFVTRLVTAFDCGAVVNPDHLKNQIEGAVTMGLGGAMFEAIEFENGKITNGRFAKYRVPRFSDAPLLETVLIDRKDVPSAGAGETPIVATAPAVGNAIFQATGQRLRSMPMAPHGMKL